jgi:hypothetical protein
MHGAPALTWSNALAASAYEFFKGASMATARHADSYILTDAQGGAAGETLRSRRCCNALSQRVVLRRVLRLQRVALRCSALYCVTGENLAMGSPSVGAAQAVRAQHARAQHARAHMRTRAHTGEDVVRRGGEMRAVSRLRNGQERVGRAFHRDDLEGDDGHGLRKVNERTGQSRGTDVV